MKLIAPIAAARGPYLRTQIAAPVIKMNPALTSGGCTDSAAAASTESRSAGISSAEVTVRLGAVASVTMLPACTESMIDTDKRLVSACSTRTAKSPKSALSSTPVVTARATVSRACAGSCPEITSDQRLRAFTLLPYRTNAPKDQGFARRSLPAAHLAVRRRSDPTLPCCGGTKRFNLGGLTNSPGFSPNRSPKPAIHTGDPHRRY